MMKQIIVMVIFALMVVTLNAKSKVMLIDKSNIEKVVKIKEIKNGKVYSRDLYVVKNLKTANSNSMVYYTFSNGTKFNSKSQIMIKFNKKANINIGEIEKKYNLKLKREMNSGDYLFENLGTNTYDTVNMILEKEFSQVERVKPNLILNEKLM